MLDQWIFSHFSFPEYQGPWEKQIRENDSRPGPRETKVMWGLELDGVMLDSKAVNWEP